MYDPRQGPQLVDAKAAADQCNAMLEADSA